MFSITFAASAVLMSFALKTPAVIIWLYTLLIVFNDSSSIPETIFIILSIVCSLSPGFILSGLYPTLKSCLTFNPDSCSNNGVQISSVTPG